MLKVSHSLFLIFLVSCNALAQFPVPRIEDLPEDVRTKLLEVQQTIKKIQQGNVPKQFADNLPENQRREMSIAMGINRLFIDINANRLVMPDRLTRNREAGRHNSPSILIPQELASDLNSLDEEFLRQDKKTVEETYLTKGSSAPRFWSILARIISLSGAWEDAERTYQRAFSLINRSGCEGTLIAFDVVNDYVGFLIHTGRLDEALEVIEQAETKIRARLDATSPGNSGGLNNLAGIFQIFGGMGAQQPSLYNNTQLGPVHTSCRI